MSKNVTNEKTRYLMKFIPVLLALLIIGLIITACGFLLNNLICKIYGLSDYFLSINEFPEALVFVEVGETIGAIILVLLFKITLTRESIKGHSFFGFKRHPTWEQIESVKPFNFLFLKYLRVYTNDGKSPIWLPLFIKNGDDFIERILEFAPKENPLRKFFENYTF